MAICERTRACVRAGLAAFTRMHAVDLRAGFLVVVFTSGLSMGAPDLVRGGRYIHGLSQTPQVLLDHQVGETGDGLLLTWDAAEAIRSRARTRGYRSIRGPPGCSRAPGRRAPEGTFGRRRPAPRRTPR